MRLGTKIIIGFICISLLLAFIGFISDQFTSEIRKEQLRYVNEASEVIIYTGEMERSLFQSLIFLNGVREAIELEEDYSTVQELPAVAKLSTQFEDELNRFEVSLEKLKEVLGRNGDIPEDIDDLSQSYRTYRSIARQWLGLGRDKDGRANLMFINSIEPYFRNNIIPEITEVREFALFIQAQRNQTLDESLSRAAVINNVATGLSVLFAILLAVYIYRSIANPLSKVSRSAKKLGEGKLDERIAVESKDEIGELAETFNSMAEGLQDKTVSKAYVDNIIESIQEALLVADDQGVLTRVNSAATKLTGYRADEMIGKPIKEFYDLEKDQEAYEKNAPVSHSFEFSLLHKEGHSIPVLFSEADLRNNQGNNVGTVAVASDITERKKQEEEIRASLREKEVMLAEIHHRVKNNLAVISGLLQLQSHNSSDEEVVKALNDSQMRIQSIALVHEMLYESESLAYIEYGEYVNDLLQAIKSMHMSSGKNISLVADVQHISLSINQAIPFSLLINELIENAFKHAFKDQDEGEIKVSLRENGGQIEMIISDNGRGIDTQIFEESGSLGITLIKTLTRQLSGELKVLDNREAAGSAFRIRFEKSNKKI